MTKRMTRTFPIIPTGVTRLHVFPRYCATRGLLFSHVGWIFFKPKYPKLHLIEREDLEEDPGESTRRGPAPWDKSADRVPHA
jgi:hypothetical protein